MVATQILFFSMIIVPVVGALHAHFPIFKDQDVS